MSWPASSVPIVSIVPCTATATAQSGLPDRALDAGQPRLDVDGVLDRFDQQDIHAALDQAERLFLVCIGDLIEGDASGDRDGLGARAHRADDEARFVRGAESVGLVAGQLGGARLIRPVGLRRPYSAST